MALYNLADAFRDNQHGPEGRLGDRGGLVGNFDGPSGSGPADQPAEADSDLTAKIERLAALRTAGHLTEAEFTTAKKTLLSDASRSEVGSPTPPPRAADLRTPGSIPTSGAESVSALGDSSVQAQPSAGPVPPLGPPASWPGRSVDGLTAQVSYEGPAVDTMHLDDASQKPSKKLVVTLVLVAVLVVGGAIAYSVLGSRRPHQTVHGTFTISNASYDSSNEFEDPNYTGGINGCEGDGGYGDLNSITQVVVKDDQGDEVARTELGEGHESDDGIFSECKFKFQFDVTKGSKYFVVSVGHRGESKYTYEELSEPEAISLIIGN